MMDTWQHAVQLLLIVSWLWGSTLVWAKIGRLRAMGMPPLELPSSPLARIPWGVALGTLLWIAFQILMQLTTVRDATAGLSLVGVQLQCGINFAIAALLPLGLTEGRRAWADFGLSPSPWKPPLELGIQAFFAAVLPTAALLVISALWRSVDTQHSHLQALRDPENTELVLWILVSAVVAAPLAEELLFRVILQSWLAERLPASLAIGSTAIIFALVHGWRDALPLLPLALILGYVFHQTRSYWACVATHALFNVSNLAMALLAE